MSIYTNMIEGQQATFNPLQYLFVYFLGIIPGWNLNSNSKSKK
jgi:hypothetical protein